VFACSGTLVSPTVLITAAHCFSDSTSAFGVNSVTGAPMVRASFDPNLINTPAAQRVWFFGSYYFDPQFALGAGGGLPGFDTHDVAVVIFTSEGCAVPPGQRGTNSCGPIPGGTTSNQFGALPTQGLVDTLPMGTPVGHRGSNAAVILRYGSRTLQTKRPKKWACRNEVEAAPGSGRRSLPGAKSKRSHSFATRIQQGLTVTMVHQQR